MEGFFQAAAAVLLATVLTLTLERKTIGTVLAMAVCAMVLWVALGYLKPVLDFLEQLETLGDLQGDMIAILLKISGISVITQIAALACGDSGNASMAQALKMLSSAVTLWLSIPIFQTLMELVQRILEGA